MEGLLESYYNFSVSALVRSNGAFDGGIPFSNPGGIINPLSASTTLPPFYYTTLSRSSISLDDEDNDRGSTLNDSYSIGDYYNGSDSITSKRENFDGVGADNSVSLGRNNVFLYRNRTLMISDLPEEYRVVDETAWPRIYIYFVVFIASAIANFCELVWVCKRLRMRSSPINRLFLHLCIADLIVVVAVAAVEVWWRINIGWYLGNSMCKAVMFFRAFGLYLSSLMIICISLDRYYAVVHPLRVIDASRRVKIMLTSAWLTAALCAAPQLIVFRVEQHPDFPVFRQCSTIWQPYIERANSWLSITMMYFVPLGVIIFSYGSIIIKIAGHLGENRDSDNNFLRRNGMPVFQRAKLRTLKLTSIIVLAFVICWSPYILISTWYLIDEKSATKLDGNLQDALFIMAVANSMANPLVYGFNESCKRRKERNHDPLKNCNRSDGAMLNNYTNSCRMSNRTRVRFSPPHNPCAQSSAV